jgi:hypothetical protein
VIYTLTHLTLFSPFSCLFLKRGRRVKKEGERQDTKKTYIEINFEKQEEEISRGRKRRRRRRRKKEEYMTEGAGARR